MGSHQARRLDPVIEAATQPAADARPKVAALASVYYYLSHAYHIVGRFLDGFPVYDGRPEPLHRPPFEIASLFIEQVSPETDLGRAKAEAVRRPPEPDDRRRADPRAPASWPSTRSS